MNNKSCFLSLVLSMVEFLEFGNNNNNKNIYCDKPSKHLEKVEALIEEKD